MNSQNSWIRPWGWRLLGVFTSLGLSVGGLRSVLRSSETLVIFASMLFMMAGMVVLAILVAFPIAGWLGEWVSRMMFFSSEREATPLNYYLAERYEREMKWENCLQEYSRIATYQPQELAAWLGCMRVALVGFDDLALARRFLRKARRKMGGVRSRVSLDTHWAELCRDWRVQREEV